MPSTEWKWVKNSALKSDYYELAVEDTWMGYVALGPNQQWQGQTWAVTRRRWETVIETDDAEEAKRVVQTLILLEGEVG